MSDSNPPPANALTAATQMVKSGRLEEARETLMQYLMKNPSSEQAWLLMSYILSDPSKQKDCLERVLKINPNNTVAQSKLAHLLGRRTEELFYKGAQSPQPAVSKSEPMPAPEPEPVPEPEPEPAPPPVLKTAAKPKLEPLPPLEKTAFERKPAPPLELQPPAPVVPETPPDRMPSPAKKPLFSGKWFKIITIALLALIVILIALIVYLGVIGPALTTMLATPTPTTAPVRTVDLPLPLQWTQTLTPTETQVPPATETPAIIPDFTPSETTIS